jgi:cyclophilin family peptidyl-prolyl cis-trans isomerase
MILARPAQGLVGPLLKRGRLQVPYGGMEVQTSRKFIVACFATAPLLALAFTGCNRGGDSTSPTPAAVKGPGGEATSSSPDGSANATPKAAQDRLHPVVVFETSLGKFAVRLDAEKAQRTVGNFLEYVDSGHYDQTILHQVLQDYPKVVIGGSFTPQIKEKSRRAPISNEADNGLMNRRGTIAMARQPDAIASATCDFFINLADNKSLDHKDETKDGYGYCVFGEVVEGMDVVDRIGQVQVHDVDDFPRIPVEAVVIKSVRQVR